jgi:hypothetical protein
VDAPVWVWMPLRAAASFWAVTVTLSVFYCASAGDASSAMHAAPKKRMDRNMTDSE